MDGFLLIGRGLGEAFSMFWSTLWALVLGFALSGMVQAFVSRDRMQSALGDHRPATIAKASVFGAISSSCSYAASALAKSLFARSADFTSAMVFMVASTNLVIELGIVLWLLLGWQFALAEFVGGVIMVTLLSVALPRVVPVALTTPVRERLQGGPSADDSPAPDPSRRGSRPWRTRSGWSDAAAYTISDLTMLRKELVIGFLVAGLLAVVVPAAVWQSVFFTGHGFWSSVENVLVAPLIAVISFVCSVGNVPLAAALWHGGISFGGVVAFVFADLITLPLLFIYRKYYGTAITIRILATFWASMSIAGLVVEYLFAAVRIAPPAPASTTALAGVGWGPTTWLNIVALAVFATLYWLHRTRSVDTSRYARDPVCGMQVERAYAPATRRNQTKTSFFCSDHCAARFDSDPARFGAADLPEPNRASLPSTTGQPPLTEGAAMPDASATAIDPICGMTVDIDTAPFTAEYHGQTYYFCAAGCQKAFTLNPEAFASAEAPQA
ncbi:permease [Curtobacterium ammoniigenes]|uniref:permease n=1 Tax=Curtobacterium ammoniigenes TaxID=395387 RepID=UPI00082F6C86|nr:permease [Curtobacterium ammoniigenes]